MRITNFSTWALAATLLLGACSKRNSEETEPDMVIPPDPGPIAASAADRVYLADQSSNTVSVHDPSTNKLLGVIRLGKGRPEFLSPLYDKESNVHGLGVSPDGKTLGVIATLTNAVVFIDLATNAVKGKVYVARNPHEGFFSPDGKQFWVTVRGADYVTVIDVEKLQAVKNIKTAPGPGMVVFRPDGKVAFVDHSFTAEVDVVDVKTREVTARIPVVSKFSPNLVVTADGQQVWLTHKDVGKVTVLNAQTYAVEGVIDTGPGTNHVNMAGPGGGTRFSGASAGEFAYVSVGGENAVKVYSRQRQLLATIPVGANPHGIWPNGDGSKVYVGLENGDALVSIDTRTNTKLTETGSGQAPQALLYVVKAGGGSPGMGNLEAFTPAAPVNIRLVPVGTQPVPGVGGGATVRPVEEVDEMVLALKQLAANTTYTMYLSDSKTTVIAPEPVISFKTDAQGAVEVNAYYQIRLRLAGRFAVVVLGDKNPAGAVTLTQL
jgi:YVTN family beta-propeller protein